MSKRTKRKRVNSKSSKMNKGEIYIITCETSGKQYVGQCKSYQKNGYKHGRRRRFQHHLNEAKNYGKEKGCRILNSAIKKYGSENFSVKLLKKCPIADLDKWEQYYIRKYNTLAPNGYNIRTGGSRGKHCASSCEKMRQSKLGPKNHNYGKPRSEETKKKISEKKKGEKHHFYGKELTPEHKLALSISHKKRTPGKGSKLPIYMVYVKERPEHYCSEGYAILNHPTRKKKYFTSKKLSLEEKYNLALEFLNELNEDL
jgi:group I intron endonuclease